MAEIDKLIVHKELEYRPEDFYNEAKKIYETVPVFPFFKEEDIISLIETKIDSEILGREVKEIYEAAKKEGSIIDEKNYVISLVAWNEFPQLITMLTIIREWAFRNEGGGVGTYDMDEYDQVQEMKQLMILNPDFTHPVEAIIGGYRYMEHHKDSYERGPMGAHYVFTDDWKKELWIELGRSFINPYYTARARKESFDYVLHGLGYIYAHNPQYKGYFGKVTLYQIYERQGADAFFLAAARQYFLPSSTMHVKPSEMVAEGVLTDDHKEVLDRDVFKGLFLLLRKEFHINIVPIMAVYNRMVDLDKMHYFGAFRHKAFGNTTEVGIAIAFDDIYPIIKEKFANQYML